MRSKSLAGHEVGLARLSAKLILVRHPACPGRARAAPYSSPRAVPKILLVVDVQLRERPRNTLSRYNTSTD